MEKAAASGILSWIYFVKPYDDYEVPATDLIYM